MSDPPSSPRATMMRGIVATCILLAATSVHETSAFVRVHQRQWNAHKQVKGSPLQKQSSSFPISPDAQSVSSSSSTALAYTVSPEPIHTAFSVANFGPQGFWLLMILLPKWNVTKKIMGGFEVVLLFCLVHFFIVATSIAVGGSEATAPLAEFNDVFDPAGDPQNAFIGMVTNYPNFVAEEWSHVLTWDLLVGRYIWLDGLKRGIFTSHSVLLSNLIGPPGLLLHWATCLVVGKEPWEKDTVLLEEES